MSHFAPCVASNTRYDHLHVVDESRPAEVVQSCGSVPLTIAQMNVARRTAGGKHPGWWSRARRTRGAGASGARSAAMPVRRIEPARLRTPPLFAALQRSTMFSRTY